MKQLALHEQAELLIDSYIERDTIVNLCECMDIESHINVKKDMVEDAMLEEEGSKMI